MSYREVVGWNCKLKIVSKIASDCKCETVSVRLLNIPTLLLMS